VGWYRHITLAMFALAYLTVVRTHAREQQAQQRKGGHRHSQEQAPTA
jgi:SRSO17 transposase